MPRRLYRSRSDRILGGVAAGVAEYFRIDPTIVRLAWLLIVLWGGAGLLLYIIAWVLVPQNPGSGSYTAASSEGIDEDSPRGGSRIGPYTDRDRAALGWILVAVGIGLVLVRMGIIGWLFSPTVMLAVLFIVLGLFVLGKSDRPPRVR